MDTRKRSIVKSISFRIIATIATIIIVYLITKSWTWAGVVGIVDVIIKIILYYLHERVWGKVGWGKKQKE